MSADTLQSFSAQNAPGAYPSSPRPESVKEIVSGPQSLSLAVKARKSEYIRKQKIRIKVGTWNTANLTGAENDLAGWFVQGKGALGLDGNLSGTATPHTTAQEGDVTKIESVEGQEARHEKKRSTIPKDDISVTAPADDIGLYILGLQEIVDVSSAAENLRPYSDPGPSKRWRKALQSGLPAGYKLVVEQQMSGLLMLVFASAELADSVSQVSTVSVGTGLMGYMKNKGAVCASFVLGEATRFVLVNCHLAAGSDQAARDRRNWDAGQIISRVRFQPSDEDGEAYGHAIGDEDIGFWFGDLNYRLDDIPGDDVRRLLLLHTRNEYDINNKSKRKIDSELGYISADQSSQTTPKEKQESKECEDKEGSEDEVDYLSPEADPASLHTTLQSLLPHDQLRDQQRKRKAFHEGWQEGDINFLPTYKYDVGSVGMFDSGDKRRGPSWCDRILYRTRQGRHASEKQRDEEEAAKKRDAEMKERGLEESDDVIFDSDPGTPGFPGTPGYAPDDYDEEEDKASAAELAAGHEIEDAISCEYYGSHQRVLSSDHKPLDAVFLVTYDAVDPKLKSQIHQEVAREMDKQENEARPGVTVVVDNPSGHAADDYGSGGIDFGPVRYGVYQQASLTIANTSGALTTFSFVDRPTDTKKSRVAPKWLDLTVEGESDNKNSNRNALQDYTLEPGETRQVQLSVDVHDFGLVQKLNEAVVKLEDVLVLRVTEGRDHFVPVGGIWMQSSFCRTLDDLLLVPEGGVRSRNPQVKDEAPSGQRLSAPRELFALTEAIQHLTQKAVAEFEKSVAEAIQKEPGWPFKSASTISPSPETQHILASVREGLDTGSSLESCFPIDITAIQRLEAVAATLVTFLHSLQDGIITTDLWTQLESPHLRSPNEPDEQSRVLETLSTAPVHSVAFTFVTFTLAHVAHALAPQPPSPPPASPAAPNPEYIVSPGAFAAISPTSPDLNFLTSSSDPTTPATPRFPTSATNTPKPNALTLPTRSLPFSALSNFRRARTDPPGPDQGLDDLVAGLREQRRKVCEAYADVFAEAMIRTGKPGGAAVGGKERKRLRAVLLPFVLDG